VDVMLAGACPCGGGGDYRACCGRWHAGAPAPDAEALMRSRYSAYVLKLPQYLLDTWHPDMRPEDAALGLEDAPGARTAWLGLEVKAHRITGVDTAEVDFVARFRIGGGRAHRLSEHSRFQRIDGRWYYVDGDIR
jgi:SEC-C motif-containing protein